MTDITQIKMALAAQALQVAEYLLPQGRKEAAEWRAGSVGGEKGHSLGVHLTGSKAGIWADFNTGETGDLIDLWVAARRISLVQALDEARAWLGLERPDFHSKPQRHFTRPEKPKCCAPAGRVRDYLIEIRNLPEEIITRYHIGERGDEIIFPFLLPNGELALAKARQAIAGGKTKPTAGGCEPVLFGWQAINPEARQIVITEGEIDALSMAAYGWPALSVPFGGGKGAKQQWIENEFERMERFEKIYLALDMDKPGDEAAAVIAERLGRHRCYRVKLPFKDANECLVEGVAKADIDAAMRNAASLDPEGLQNASFFVDAVTSLFHPTEGMHEGYQMPYSRLRNKVIFRPGEVTLWSGASGAGKSQILSDCAVDWVRQGSVICLASLEMSGPQSLKRMVKQTTDIATPSVGAIKETLRWLDQGLLIYELVGKASVQTLTEVFSYAKAKYGADQFIIDSLMRLGVASDDYTGQEKAMFQMVDWTVSSSVHLHLVAHARKGGSDAGAPETEDVKGAMEIGANAFNIITVWRNRKLEDARGKLEYEVANQIIPPPDKDGKQTTMAQQEKKLSDLRNQPGVILNIAKQRNGDFEGKAGLWFDQQSYRYRGSGDSTRSYLTRENLERISNGYPLDY